MSAPASPAPGDILRFLIGDRQAIVKLAASRHTFGLGALLVFSAALARRYDRADLVAEPWHLVMPLAVSLVNASVLFGMVYGLFLRRASPRPSAGASYRALLGLFWMTAPLAWLYALPVERFFDPVAATAANLSLLLVVALWRVLLYARILAVLLGIGHLAAGYLVMLFGDLVALGLMYLSPKPVVAVMGGVMHAPEDALILEVGGIVLLLGLVTLPVWAICTLLTAFTDQPSWKLEPHPQSAPGDGRSLLVLGLGSVLFWLPILPFTQSEQRLATRVDDALAANKIDVAVELMSSYERSSFPPHFNPRPTFWRGRQTPSVWLVLHEANQQQAPRWVLDLYLAKAERVLQSSGRLGIEDQLAFARAASVSDELVELAARNERTSYLRLPEDPDSELGRLMADLYERLEQKKQSAGADISNR